MLGTNFIRAFLSSTRVSQLKNAHGVWSEVLKNKSCDFMFGQYYLQAIDFIEFKIYEPFVQQSTKQTPVNSCSIFFDNKVWSL